MIYIFFSSSSCCPFPFLIQINLRNTLIECRCSLCCYSVLGQLLSWKKDALASELGHLKLWAVPLPCGQCCKKEHSDLII